MAMLKVPHTRSNVVLSIALVLVTGITASAQLGGLGGITNKLKKQAPVSSLMDRMPITTSLPDAKWGDVSKDGFTPRDPERSLMTLQRTPSGGFVLQPGYYMLVDQSYC